MTYEEYVATANTTVLPPLLKKTDMNAISEIFYQTLGLTDPQELNLFSMIIHYAGREVRSSDIKFRSLFKVLMGRMRGQHEAKVKSRLLHVIRAMEENGLCVVDPKSKDFAFILSDKAETSVQPHGALLKKIDSIYEEMTGTEKWNRHFPDDEDLGYRKLPEDICVHFPVSDYTKRTIEKTDIDIASIIIIDFPNESRIFATRKYFDRLFEISLNKVRSYLNDETNGDKVERMRFHLNKAQQASRRKVYEIPDFLRLLRSYDFSDPLSDAFLAWLLMLDFARKEQISSRYDKDFYHGSSLMYAYLIGENEQAKLRRNKELKLDDDIRLITGVLQSQCRVFSTKDLGNIVDPSDRSTMRARYSEEGIDLLIQALKERNTVGKMENEGKTPEVLCIEAGGADYFIHRSRMLEFILGEIELIRRQFVARYGLKWSQDIKNYEESNRAMLYDADYENLLSSFIGEKFPLISALVSKKSSMLLGRAHAPRSIEHKTRHWFAGEEIRELSALIGLSRDEMYAMAENFLTIPWNFRFARNIRHFFLRMFRKSRPSDKAPLRRKDQAPVSEIELISEETKDRPKTDDRDSAKQGPSASERKSAKHSKRQMQEKKTAAARKLVETLAGKEPIRVQLDQLANKWNPSLDPKARKITRENVDDEIVRVVRKIYRNAALPLQAEPIELLAGRIANDPLFQKIGQKDVFKKYIVLLILKNFIKPSYKI